MDPTIRTNLRSGNHLGSDDSKLISGDVPDQIKRVGAKVKPVTYANDDVPDFSQRSQVDNPNPNLVDTGNQSPRAQEEDLINRKKSVDNKAISSSPGCPCRPDAWHP